MLWPGDVNTILTELETTLDGASSLAEHTGDYGEAAETEQKAIGGAIAKLIDIGQRHASG